ncbi:hypothetical protein CBER1_10816 [Cercospora berteroae]|uniref:NADP-dependent oxidoreductase domain-containing protein n=1 Tax=Cercospora berteroae TaxID=357750 RepID=A0A2S6CM71_9PEZI|nr:hypothetical protein CBER1_10816 [Cercospora berteroae]
MASARYPQRKIGDDYVSAQGLGCMGMSFSYTSGESYNDEESAKVLTRALDLGINFWDTTDVYGPHTNEQLIGKWFKDTGRRKEVFLATKFGHTRGSDGSIQVRGDKEYVKQACYGSLERLGVEQIELYYQHRVDDKTPIEETVQAMVELKNEGKFRYLGLSECSAATLRRAVKVHPIAAAQMEFSPFALEIESEQTDFLRTAHLDETDGRRNHPRFSEEHFADNLKLVTKLTELAAKKGATPGQLALAWVLSQGDDFLLIPGTKRIKYLEENAKAIDIQLTKEDDQEIRKAIESTRVTPTTILPCATRLNFSLRKGIE